MFGFGKKKQAKEQQADKAVESDAAQLSAAEAGQQSVAPEPTDLPEESVSATPLEPAEQALEEEPAKKPGLL